MAEHKIITIGREFGSGGHEIGNRLANHLDIPLYDNNLIRMVAEKLDICEDTARAVDETTLNNFLSGFAIGASGENNGSCDMENVPPLSEQVYELQSEIIRKLADRGPCVIVGRCADYVLKDRENCIHAFVCADIHDRIKRIAKKYDISEKKAADLIKRRDTERKHYYESHTGLEWGSIASHQLLINVSRLGMEKAVLILEKLYDYEEKKVMKPIKSFREYVEKLKECGEIVTVEKEVDWNLEMAAITRHAYDLPSPAPLFENVKDCTPGFRVLGAPVGLSPDKDQPFKRVALSLGLPADTLAPELVAEWSKLADMEPIPPRVVETGACKQNKLFGKDIDLTKLPIPFIHYGDGGRYINTYGIFIAQTPDGSWVNWAISRAMLDGPQTIAGVVIPTQDFGKIYAQWKAIGKEMPFALCLGVDPAIAMIAGYPLPSGINEGEMIGGWYGEAVDVVKCETTDLLVPASSEIVIEGFASLDKTVPEGPMGEYGGYVWSGKNKPVPCFDVTAMTYRDNPIMPLCVAGVPTEENHTNWGVSIAASIQNVLEKQGFPIKECFIPMESAAHWFVVSVDRNRTNEDDEALALEIGKAVFASKGGSYIPKVIVVDDDIDPSSLNQVVWALATRHHPDRRVAIPDQYIFPLVAYLSAEEKAEAVSTRVIYNCLTPFHKWPEDRKPVEASFRGYPEELQKHVLENWENYGF